MSFEVVTSPSVVLQLCLGVLRDVTVLEPHTRTPWNVAATFSVCGGSDSCSPTMSSPVFVRAGTTCRRDSSTIPRMRPQSGRPGVGCGRPAHDWIRRNAFAARGTVGSWRRGVHRRPSSRPEALPRFLRAAARGVRPGPTWSLSPRMPCGIRDQRTGRRFDPVAA